MAYKYIINTTPSPSPSATPAGTSSKMAVVRSLVAAILCLLVLVRPAGSQQQTDNVTMATGSTGDQSQLSGTSSSAMPTSISTLPPTVSKTTAANNISLNSVNSTISTVSPSAKTSTISDVTTAAGPQSRRVNDDNTTMASPVPSNSIATTASVINKTESSTSKQFTKNEPAVSESPSLSSSTTTVSSSPQSTLLGNVSNKVGLSTDELPHGVTAASTVSPPDKTTAAISTTTTTPTPTRNDNMNISSSTSVNSTITSAQTSTIKSITMATELTAAISTNATLTTKSAQQRSTMSPIGDNSDNVIVNTTQSNSSTIATAATDGDVTSSTKSPAMTDVVSNKATTVTNQEAPTAETTSGSGSTSLPSTSTPLTANSVEIPTTSASTTQLPTSSTPLPTTTRVSTTTAAPLNPCDTSPCRQGATCAPNADGGFFCDCAPGWTGETCNDDIDECASSPCANSAPCENGENYFRCNCPPGFTGTFCDEDIDYCATNSCMNGGTCRDEIVSFSCDCSTGFTGATCETNIDDCVGTPCSNNATCVDGINSYTCQCTRYWTGITCQDDIDECSLNPRQDCDPLSTCVNTEGGFTCTCPLGYGGDGANCLFIDLCKQNPCENGVCLAQMMDYVCICDKGWTGPNCTEDINECENAVGVCDVMYGECINMAGSFRCQCRAGSHGDGRICFRDTVYPHGDSNAKHNQDTIRDAMYPIPGGFPYYGKRYYKVYASIDGHVTFTQDYLPPNPPGGATPYFPSDTAVLAPWWTDLDTTSGPGSLYVDVYDVGDESTAHDVVFSNISADVNKFAPDVNLTYVVVFTWNEVEPYPSYVAPSGKENATFQLVLATTTEESFGMFNYNPDGPWLNMNANERRFLMGYSIGNGTAVRIELEQETPGFQSNIGHNGRYFFKFGDKIPSADLQCLSWYKDNQSDDPVTTSPPCPCTMMQALHDTRFSLNMETSCADTVFADQHGVTQRCCYDSIGALYKDYPYGGYSVLPEDGEARKFCCETTDLCHLFYKLRPSDTCQDYTLPYWALAWGIGHFQTVNKETVNFNSRGLFTLFDQGNFTLQGFMDLVPTLVTDMMTTALVAVACKAWNSSTIEVGLDRPTNDLVVLVDGVESAPGMYRGVQLTGISDDTILMQFMSGQGVLVTAVDDVLRVRLSVPEVMQGTKGLFTATPGGTLLQVSQYASIPEGGVLFANKNVSFPGYVPSDLSAAIGELRKRVVGNQSEAAESCDDMPECLYDYIATGGDIYRGISAITERTIMKENRRKLEALAPVFRSDLPSVLKVDTSGALTLTVTARDPSGDQISYNISTNASPNDYVFVDSGYFRYSPTNTNTSVYFRFTATTSGGATSLYWPEVKLCACTKSQQCDYDSLDIPGIKSNDERYFKTDCLCAPGYSGATCSDVLDMCATNPCYTATNSCVSMPGLLPHGFTCPPCPGNLKGDGIRCYDENECLRGTSQCSHICINQYGGYRCECPKGYYLHTDSVTCLDYDECTAGEHMCFREGEFCRNLPGTFTCDCKASFYKDSGACVFASNRYGGQIAFQALQTATGETLTYTDELQNKQSERYKQEKTIVEQWLQTLEPLMNQPGFKATRVTDFSQGSTVAQYNIHSDQPINMSNVDSDIRRFLEAQGCTPSGPACTVGPLIGVDVSKSFVEAKDLCEDEEDNDCDSQSTSCSSFSNGTFSCQCRPGFRKWLDINTICQDVNECESYNECDKSLEFCVNTPGSYKCSCRDSYRPVGDTCVPACVPNPCQNKGECYPDSSVFQRYTCRCKGFWSGPNCTHMNKKARDLETILIAVGVALGALCLILLIIIIVVCLRCRRVKSTDSETTEVSSDKHMNERPISIYPREESTIRSIQKHKPVSQESKTGKRENFEMRTAKRTYSTTNEVGMDSWENNTHSGAPSAHLRSTQFEMTENGSKQNLLSGKSSPFYHQQNRHSAMAHHPHHDYHSRRHLVTSSPGESHVTVASLQGVSSSSPSGSQQYYVYDSYHYNDSYESNSSTDHYARLNTFESSQQYFSHPHHNRHPQYSKQNSSASSSIENIHKSHSLPVHHHGIEDGDSNDSGSYVDDFDSDSHHSDQSHRSSLQQFHHHDPNTTNNSYDPYHYDHEDLYSQPYHIYDIGNSHLQEDTNHNINSNNDNYAPPPPEAFQDPPEASFAYPDVADLAVPAVGFAQTRPEVPVYAQIERRKDQPMAAAASVYSPRRPDGAVGNYDNGGSGTGSNGAGIGVENPSYAASTPPHGVGTNNKLDSQYF